MDLIRLDLRVSGLAIGLLLLQQVVIWVLLVCELLCLPEVELRDNHGLTSLRLHTSHRLGIRRAEVVLDTAWQGRALVLATHYGAPALRSS